MAGKNLYRIVEVSLKNGDDRRDVGIMTVRQALELPDVPSLEYTHPERNSLPGGPLINRAELQAYACCG